MNDLYNIVEVLKSKRVIRKDVEIAEKTGYSKQLVSNYIKGRQKPSKAFLEKFYEVFNISGIDTLYLNEDSPTYTTKKARDEICPDTQRELEHAREKIKLLERQIQLLEQTVAILQNKQAVDAPPELTIPDAPTPRKNRK